jgi:hypothetical protein
VCFHETRRGNPLQKRQPTSTDRATALLHAHSLTHHDFATMQKFLAHKYELVYPNSYAINSWATRSDPSNLQQLDPTRHLRVYKMIDARVFQRAIRRQAYDRGLRVEKDYTKVGHVAEEVRVVASLPVSRTPSKSTRATSPLKALLVIAPS